VSASEPGHRPVRRAAVLGRPIGYSLSPRLHHAAYAALGLDWRYDAIDCGVAELPRLLSDAGPEWAGFSCTMPIKYAAWEFAATRTERAVAVGAANTLLPDADATWRADNTDVVGIDSALAEHEVRPTSAAILGAGGTAAAAVVALASQGVSTCVVAVRDPVRAARLRETAERVGLALDVCRIDDRSAILAVDLVISTVPWGAADPLADWPWRPSTAVLDVVYEPWPTAIAAAVIRAGGLAIGGQVVLLHQAVEQVRLMTGRPPPVAAMRAALDF
jgi:shikimate dehydrogenase